MFAIYRQPQREPLPIPGPVGRRDIFHAQDHPFCDDPNCRCHGQPTLLHRLHTASHNEPADVGHIGRGGTY